MEKTLTITLSNGTVLENIGITGNNYISSKKIKDSVFEGNLGRVEIYDSATKETTILHDAELVQNIKCGSEYWFIFREKSQEEIEIEALNGAVIELAEIIGNL